MDSPISNNSPVSSLNAMSPQVFSPQPRRTPYPQNRKNNLNSIPFLDLLDDSGDFTRSRSKTQHYLIEKLHKFSIDDADDYKYTFPFSMNNLTCFFRLEPVALQKSHSEIERKSILNCIKMLENPLENMRPPTRANNPQVNDQQFVKMDHETKLFKEEKFCLERVKNI